ncbi:hypothetical protein EMIT0P265_80106 [Pseudomonas zeae]
MNKLAIKLWAFIQVEDGVVELVDAGCRLDKSLRDGVSIDDIS